MREIVLFGAVDNIDNILDVLNQLREYEVVEIWDNFSPIKHINNGTKMLNVVKPHRMKKTIPVLIIPDRYEREIQRQLTEELGIPLDLIKPWRYCFHHIKELIIKKYDGISDDKLCIIINYLKENHLNVFNDGLFEKYQHNDKNIKIYRDDTSGLLYSYWGQKKLYMKRGMSEESARGYINSLCMEQDKSSPHCYEQQGIIGRKNDVIVDAGTAEGFFALERVDTARYIYLIENDELWLEALRYTFEPYMEKVTIIPKQLADCDDALHITLDCIDCIGHEITVVKMDIEGGERDALRGGKKILLQNRKIDMVVCAYHCSGDEDELSQALLDFHFNVSFTNGYMFFAYDKHIAPELRHGLIIAEKRKSVRAYIWGLGEYYPKLRKAIKSECIIEGLLDSSPDFVKTADSNEVNLPNILKTSAFDYVIVTASDTRSIKEKYLEYGLPAEKLICLWEIETNDYDFIDYNAVKLVKQEYYLEKYKLRLKNAPFEYGGTCKIVIIDAKVLLNKIFNEKKSLSRFGDGEFEIMRMKSRPWFQEPTPELSIRLKKVIQSELASLCIAVADNYGNLDKYTEQAADGIRKYIAQNNTREDTFKFLSPNKTYYDAYVSRPYIIYKDKERAAEIFKLWKRVWDNRDILLIEGETLRMGMGNDLFSNANSIRRILCPERNAFQKYDNILEKIVYYANKNDLILITLGPTATVLAYDLAKLGHQAVDVGQLDNEYDWWKMKTDRRVAIRGKTVAEVSNGRKPDMVDNFEIKNEILCHIE